MIKILPQFIKIFRDFGAELPAMTRQLFRSVRWCDESGLAMLLIVVVNLLLFYAVARRFGWIHWDLPGMGRLMRRADTALILDSLGLAAAKDRPMLDAVRDLEESYPKPAIRRRLRRAAAAVAAGEDWCESLFRQGLIGRADRAILLAAQRVGNLPWALREMADSNRRRLLYRSQALVQALFPPMVIFFGLIVMYIVVALFWPLIALIEKLS